MKDNGEWEESSSPQEFFSIEVDPSSDDPGAQIYLRDKAHFLGKSK